MDELFAYLKGKGYDIEKIDRGNRNDVGYYADVFYINDKVVRVVSTETGMGATPVNVRDEIKIYSKLEGKTHENIVQVLLSKYFENKNASIVVMEKLDVVWKNMRSEFNDLFDLIFEKYKAHNKLSVVPSEDQINAIIMKTTNEDWDIRGIKDLTNDEKKLIMDVFKGTYELRTKYNHLVNDLHVANVMKDPNSGNYKLIDIGI